MTFTSLAEGLNVKIVYGVASFAEAPLSADAPTLLWRVGVGIRSRCDKDVAGSR